MTLNKEQFIDFIAANSGKTKIYSKEALELILDQFREAIFKGHEVKLSGFGKLEIVDRKGRTGVMNGKEWTSQDRKIAKFTLTDPIFKNVQ